MVENREFYSLLRLIIYHRSPQNPSVLVYTCWWAFLRLMLRFANILDPDQDQQKTRPDIDANCLTLSKCS